MRVEQAHWALILAGGDGTRLLPFTRPLSGDDRPKQFCPVLGRETLFEATRRRVAMIVARERTLVVLCRGHEPFYASLMAGFPDDNLVVQPENRGTATAILYGALRLASRAPAAAMAVFPSDHYVSDDARFMAHVLDAFEVVAQRPDLVVLLGIVADRPETAYGWIEPGDPIPASAPMPVRRVCRFWEKPSVGLAARLRSIGCLWNSFVMVARVPALLGLMRNTIPDLVGAFERARPTFNTLREPAAMRQVYARLQATDFCRTVLDGSPSNLAVLAVQGLGWSDLGEPERVRDILARIS
jgi:mannose-1-phosphate guanylyltransferase